MLSNAAVKSGQTGWNWYTDLGSNFIGSYSFYTLGSPFFWLSLYFSRSDISLFNRAFTDFKVQCGCGNRLCLYSAFWKYKPYAIIRGTAVFIFRFSDG